MTYKSSFSGFPELLPQERLFELQVLEKIQRAFKLHGFLNIETRAVEPVSALLSKGETSKEIYLLSRLQEAVESGESSPINLESAKQLGLHFDLTVPFARFVVENQGQLQFPFRRTSVGKVWRGERPQSGRFREFTQADVDIIAKVENGQTAKQALPIFQDADIVAAVDDALTSLRDLGLPRAAIHVNNREVLQSCYTSFGIADLTETLRIVDKLDKNGAEEVKQLLMENGEARSAAEKCVKLASVSAATGDELSEKLSELVDLNKVEGLDDLIFVLDNTSENVVADLKIARGLDYYTGSVFETFLEGFESVGSISSGGRYENLASSINSKLQLPGVGMSIGVTRLVSILLDNGLAKLPETEVEVMVIVNSEEEREQANQVAQKLRAEGRPAIVSPTSAKFGKQIEFASKRGIRNVVFLTPDGLQIKDIVSGEQRAL